jgi:hypothetical protein
MFLYAKISKHYVQSMIPAIHYKKFFYSALTIIFILGICIPAEARPFPVHKSYTCNFNNGLGNWFTDYNGQNRHFLTLVDDKSSPGNKYVVLLSEFDDISSRKSFNLVLFPTKQGKVILSGKAKGLSGHEKMEIENWTDRHLSGCKGIHPKVVLPVSRQWTNFKITLGGCAEHAHYLQIRISAAKDIKGEDKRQDLRLALDDLRVEGAEFMIKPAPKRKKRKIIVKKIKKDSLPAISRGNKLTSQQILTRLYLCKNYMQLTKEVKEIRKSADIDTFNIAIRTFWKKSLFSKGLRYEKYEMLAALNPDWTLKITNKMIDLKKLMRNRIKIGDTYCGLVLQAVYSDGSVLLLLKKDGYMRIGRMDLKSGKIKILNQVKESRDEFNYFTYHPALASFSVAGENAYINTKKNEFYCLPLNGGKIQKLKNWPGKIVSYVTEMGKRLYVVVDNKVFMSSDFDGTNRKLIASLKRDIANNDIEKIIQRSSSISKIIPLPEENCLFLLAGNMRTVKYFPKTRKSEKVQNFPVVDILSHKLFVSIIDNEIYIAISGGFRPKCLIYDITSSNKKIKLQTGIRIKGVKQFFCRENEIYYTCSKNSIRGSSTSSSSGIYNYKKPAKSPVLFLPTAIAIYPHTDGKSFYLIGLDVILKITPKK